MAAIVGLAGLAPTLAAIRRGRTVALANKEALVAAGDVVTAAVQESGATLLPWLPVDSEHNAIFQCLDGGSIDRVRRITLTASGGPFRTMSLDEMHTVTREQALKHPNWSMGRKISIDSATMMNKGSNISRPIISSRSGSIGSIFSCIRSRSSIAWWSSSIARRSPSSAARTCASPSPTRWPGPTAWQRPASRSISPPSAGSTSRRRMRSASPRPGWRARRSSRAAARRHSQCRERNRGRRVPGWQGRVPRHCVHRRNRADAQHHRTAPLARRRHCRRCRGPRAGRTTGRRIDRMMPTPGLTFTILSFLLVIGPLVFIHEMGHYWVGRWFGVHAEAFSIGFGRKSPTGPTGAAQDGGSARCRWAAMCASPATWACRARPIPNGWR